MLEVIMSTALLAAPLPPALRDETAGLTPAVRAVVACVLRERPDHADVEDCTSEALRRAIESHRQAQGPLRPWVLGIARHVALDLLRSRQRQRQRNVEIPPDAPSSSTLVDRLIDPEIGADEKLDRERQAEHVRRVLQTLPEGPRRALELFHLEGLSYQEVSARLGVPLGTVATWVTRGRKTLAEALEDRSKEGKVDPWKSPKGDGGLR